MFELEADQLERIRKIHEYEKREEAKARHPLGFVNGENLTFRELKRALRSKHITRVFVLVQIQFGDEPVEVEVTKAAVLKAIDAASDDDRGDWTTEAIAEGNNEISLKGV